MKKTTVEKDEDEDDNDKNQCSVFVQGEEEEVGVHFGWNESFYLFMQQEMHPWTLFSLFCLPL